MKPTKRTFFATIAGIGLCACASFASAQAPSGTPSGTIGGLNNQMAILNHVHARIQLTAPQREHWRAVVAQTRAAHESIRANVAQLKAETETQLSKKEPDLASLAALSDRLQAQNIAIRMKARAAWLLLYESFSADQKSLVRDSITTMIGQHQVSSAPRPEQ